jgi:hypothetical protein
VFVFPYGRYLWQRRKQMWGWTLRRRSFYGGFIGGSKFWLVIGALVHGRRLMHRVLTKEPETVAIARLPPGHSLSIRTIDPKSESSA